MNYNEIKEFIKNNPTKSKYLSVVVNEGDPLGILIWLNPSGKLVKYDGKNLPKTFTAWGQVMFKDGKPYQVPF